MQSNVGGAVGSCVRILIEIAIIMYIGQIIALMNQSAIDYLSE
jgi:hypothetical protein